jgi:hypothetical protein
MMAERYGKPIHVWLRGGTPTRFCWNSVDYPVEAVLSAWSVRGRWWADRPTTHLPPTGERRYYRVRCPDRRVFDLYYDAVAGLWLLDVLQD